MITAIQRSPPLGQTSSGISSWKVSASRLRQTTLKYSAGGAVGGLVEVPGAQLSLAGGVVAARQVDREQARHERRRDRAAGVELDRRPCRRPRASRRPRSALEQVADPLGAVALVPVVGQVVRVVRPDHRLVRGDDEALVRVEHVRQRRRTARSRRSSRSRCASPPAAGRPSLPGLADRDQARGLVADVAVAVGVHDVLRGHGERRGRLAEARPVGRGVEVEDRVSGAGRRSARSSSETATRPWSSAAAGASVAQVRSRRRR